jgi:hypothetical protein
MSFILHIFIVDNVNKLVNMGLMKNLMDFRWWDKLVRLLMALVQAGVTLRVGDSPGGPLKQMGKPRLKPAKNQS